MFGLPTLLFALITWQVVTNGPLLRVDERVSRALAGPDRVSELLASLGDVQIAVPVLALAAVYVALQGRVAGASGWWLPPLVAAVLMALVPALVIPLKEWIARHGTPVMPPATGFYPRGTRLRPPSPSAPRPCFSSPGCGRRTPGESL